MNYTDIFKKIEKRIEEGRWELAAVSWVECDLNMVNGESIAHQLLHAKKYLKHKFNYNPKLFMSPDTFGRPWTIPQILKEGDVDYYYFMRASDKDIDIFWWKGPDGSKVLCFNSSYLGGISAEIILMKLTLLYKMRSIKRVAINPWQN